MALLSGKKTIAVAVAAGIVFTIQALKTAGLPQFQGIPDGLLTYILSLLGVTGAITMRLGIAKAEK